MHMHVFKRDHIIIDQIDIEKLKTDNYVES